jgi:antitoxin PrlF
MAELDMEFEATLTDKYQTTVPGAVRKALRLGKRDRIVFLVDPDTATVTIAKRAAEEERDPVIASFLQFLARDLGAHPDQVTFIPRDLVARARDLTRGVEIDLDAPLPADEE